MHKFQQLQFNTLPEPRIDQMEGKDWTVIPMIMMVEGVHNGSGGPLFYPSSELGKTPEVWNYKPVVVYHPEVNGAPVSACEPVILSTRKIGVIMNAKFEDGKLKAEAWLDINRTKEIDDRVVNAIEEKRTLECSTGVYVDVFNEEGDFGDEHYDMIAKNHRPDHLAVLPDQIGACSVADGGGFFRLNSGKLKECAAFVVIQEQSHEGVRDLLNSAINAKFEEFVYVEEVFDDYFVYERDGRLYKQTYTVGEGGVDLTGLPEEVIRSVVYKPVTLKENSGKDVQMKKEEIINKLIEDKRTGWSEDDRDELMKHDEKFLTNMLLADDENTEDITENEEAEEQEETTETPAANQQPMIKSLDDLRKNSSPELFEFVEEGIRTNQELKKKLITHITASKNCQFTVDDLKKKPLKELKQIVALMGDVRKKNETPDFEGLLDLHETTPITNAPEPFEMIPITFDEAK